MTIEISVRLPAGLVQRLDEVVDSGLANTRSQVLTRALEREFRRLSAERDAEILSRGGRVESNVVPIEEAPVPRRARVD